jgi:hypothetical protein
MGSKYEVLAAHYPFLDYYEESFQTDSLLSALLCLRKFKRMGYEIIDIHYRAPVKIDISSWNQITCIGFGDEEDA